MRRRRRRRVGGFCAPAFCAPESRCAPGDRRTGEDPEPPSQPPAHLLSQSAPACGTMRGDCWSGSMWCATWILCFSSLIHATQAQGKRDTGGLSSRFPVSVGWLPRDAGVPVVSDPQCVHYSLPFFSTQPAIFSLG